VRREIPGFVHTPGVHCGSTAMSDVLRHQGLELSEALCFGLGAGLNLVYLRDFGTPSRALHGRGLSMEQDLCAAVGASFVAASERDPEAAWRRVRDRVDEGLPVVLQCDVRLLPHYRSTVPFNGHRVVLAGYDRSDDTAYVADTHFPGLVAVPQRDLAASRASDGPPAGYSANLWWEVRAAAGPPPDLGAAARAAMNLCGRRLLDGDAHGVYGLSALARMADEIAGWGALPDAALVAHFGFQVIERRGTGGSLFRRLYREFLADVARRRPDAVAGAAELVAAADACATAWSELAAGFRRAAAEKPVDFAPLQPIARRLVRLERALAERLAAA
jgi:hypothetical protein